MNLILIAFSLFVISLTLFISDGYSVTESSTDHGSLNIDSDSYEIDSNEQVMVKIFGTINDTSGGARLNIVISPPDGLTDGLHVTVTDNGYFETYWILENDSPLGDYKVLATYESAPIGEVHFSVVEKQFSEEELMSARELLDKKSNQTKTEDVVESVDEIETPPLIELEELSEIEKNKIESYTSQADDYFSHGDYLRSVTYYKKVIELDPENTHALNRLGISHIFLNDDGTALSYLDNAIRVDPLFPKPYYNKGLIYDSQNKFSLAQQNYDKAIELDPENMKYVLGKGLFLYFHNRYTESLTEFEKVLSKEPANIDALFSKSLALSNRDKKYDQFDALIAINHVLDIDPEYPDALHNKKIILNMIGQDYDSEHNFEEAIKYFDQILEIDPKFIDAINNKGATLSRMGL